MASGPLGPTWKTEETSPALGPYKEPCWSKTLLPLEGKAFSMHISELLSRSCWFFSLFTSGQPEELSFIIKDAQIEAC